MTSHWLCRTAAVLFLSVLAARTSLRAAVLYPQPEIKSVRLGFGNVYKLGCWTPVEVTTTSGDFLGRKFLFEIEAPDGDSVPARFVAPSVRLGFEHNEFTAYARIGRADGPIEVLMHDEREGHDGELLTLKTLSGDDLPRALPGTAELMVELGATIGLGDLFRRGEQSELERTTVVTLDTPQTLPDRWYGYEGVDLMVIVGAPSIEKSLLSAPFIDALEQWVRRGGTLLIECGDGAERVVGPAAPLARFAPGEFVQTIDRQPFGAIESYAAAEQPIDFGAAGRRTIRVPQWKNVKGRVELSERSKTTEVPLVVHWPLGFGQVLFVGFDLHQPPFAAWPERGKFLEKLLRLRTPSARPSGSIAAASPGRHLGYVDLSGQLRGALDQFEGVRLVPFWTVTLLTLTYIVMLFPLNYLLGTRWLRRPQLAWVIFPAVALLFCVAAYAMAQQAKGNRLRVNQVDVVDVDVAANWARGTTWFNLFSPANAAYDLHVNPNSTGAASTSRQPSETDQNVLGWFGLASNGLGGMSSAAASLPLIDQPYFIDPQQGTVSEAPLAKWSSKSFVARWTAPGGGVENALTATLDGRLQGTVVNRLPWQLDHCVLFFGRWAYPLETIRPGEKVRLDRREPSTVETFLTHRHLFATRNEVPPYDRADFDVARILEVMMFHNAAGGVNYTGLLNRQQAFVDLSAQLEFGQAILVGNGNPGAELQINGRPLADADISRHETVYRFVLPVAAKL